MNYVRLGDICSQESEKLKTKTDVLIDYIDISSVDNISKSIIRTQQLLSSDAPSRAQRIVEVGDILVSTVRPNLNAVAIYEKKLDNLAVASTGFCVLRCHRNISRRFVFNFCKSPYFINALSNQATGASYPAVNDAIIRAVLIPAYTYEKQLEIAQILDLVQKMIDLKKKEIVSFDNLIKARFVEMFGDPLVDNGRYPRVTLGSLADVGSSKRVFENEYVSEGVPFYRTKEIVELSKGNRITTELFISRERYEEIRKKYGVPKTGDLLISAVGTIGVIWVVDGKSEFYFKDGNLIRVAATDKFVPIYLKQLLEALISVYKKGMSSGTAYAALTIAALKEMKVYNVPIAQQQQYEAFVKQIDKSKSVVQKSLNQTQLLFDSLMQQYFG